jgi:signal transduction histidine kinase
MMETRQSVVTSGLASRLVEEGVTEARPGEGTLPVNSEKLEALAEFAAGAGHEINNPLATINGRVQLLLQDEKDPQRRQALMTIAGQVYRIRDMIGDVMLFGRPPKPESETLKLVEIVEEIVSKFSQEAELRGCSLEVVSDSASVPVWADHSQLCVVISELIRNSLNALEESGGSIRLSLESVLEGEKRIALFTISDEGVGLSAQEKLHLFDPFYSGRQAGRGLGFGLPKIWRIVSNHGGRIEVESIPQGKTTFQVYWPAGTDDGGDTAV